MGKLKLFVENFMVYGLGGIISKIIPIIMVPVITRLMPDSKYFGISDLSNTLISFASALAILGMYDAMYRMFFEKEELEYKQKICSTTLMFTIVISLIVFVGMILCKNIIAEEFFGNEKYRYIIYISAFASLSSATNQIVSAPTRMQNKRKVFLITNTISPILAYLIAIVLLLNGYYIIALPIATMISGIIMEISFIIINRKWFSKKNFDFILLKKMLAIGLPLFPNFLIYWLFNSCDRLMIVNILDIGEAGIYSVGAKLGAVSQLIYIAFAGGWQYFAFSTMKEKDQVRSNSLVFEYLGVISFVCSVIIFIVCKPLYGLLFEGDYVNGYIVSPYLFLAPLLQMLFQIAANQFLVIKKTWPNILILACGAIVNIILNLYLIPILGIEGAAIATLIGYAVSTCVCVLVLYKMKLMNITIRFVIVVGLMIIYIILWRCFFINSILQGSIFSLVFIIIFYVLYKNDICYLVSNIKSFRKK